jgi:hypothetical protein
MNVWKVLGLAGVAGVAAAGVIIARGQRQRAQLSAEEIRTRLHERLAQASAPAAGASDPPTVTTAERPWWRLPPRRRTR